MEATPLTITVDVGGQQFRTTATTIKKIPFLSDLYTNCQRPDFFVDRSPECFKYILDHARGYSLSYPSELEAKMRLIDDCHYYRTDSLLEEIEGSLTEDEQRIYRTTLTQAIDAYEKAIEAITNLSALDTDALISEAVRVQAGLWKTELEKCLRTASIEPEDAKDALKKTLLSPIQLEHIATGCSSIATAVAWHRTFFNALGMELAVRSGFSHFHLVTLHVILGVMNKQADVSLVKSLSKRFPSDESLLSILRIGIAALEALFQKSNPIVAATEGLFIFPDQPNQPNQPNQPDQPNQ